MSARDECGCGGIFRDAEDYRDHLPCPAVTERTDCTLFRNAIIDAGILMGLIMPERVRRTGEFVAKVKKLVEERGRYEMILKSFGYLGEGPPPAVFEPEVKVKAAGAEVKVEAKAEAGVEAEVNGSWEKAARFVESTWVKDVRLGATSVLAAEFRATYAEAHAVGLAEGYRTRKEETVAAREEGFAAGMREAAKIASRCSTEESAQEAASEILRAAGLRGAGGAA